MSGAILGEVHFEIFSKLSDYIEGANNESLQMEMTTPVIMKFPTRPCSFCKNTYTMMLLISNSISSPPASTVDETSLVDLQEMQIYVKTFGGFADGNEWLAEASKLHDSLNADGISDSELNLDFFYAVGYDNLIRLYERRNEIWNLKV